MGDHEDLDYNPLYKALQTKYWEKFSKAQENCYLICIPQAASLAGVIINQAFVDTHVLKPSPMLKDHYISTDKTESKTIIVDEDFVLVTEGFKNKGRIKVLSEELGYNKDYKPFKILIVQKPLEGAVKGRRGSAGLSDDFLIPRNSYDENCRLLSMFPEHQQQLKQLDESIKQFNSNYLIVKGYLNHAAEKLQELTQQHTETILANNKYVRLQSDTRLGDVLSIAVESYVTGGVHSKLFAAVCLECQEKDKILASKIQQLQHVSAEDLGISEHFCCSLPAGVVELARLDGINSPREKLVCLKTTLDVINEEVTAHLNENLAPGETPLCLTSDELIPLVVTLVAKGKCNRLASNLYYIEHFNWIKSKTDDLGFSLVTFNAVKEYILTTDFSKTASPKPKLKKEMSIKELMIAQKTLNEVGPSTSLGPSMPARTLEKQLENISKMMENTKVTPNSRVAMRSLFEGSDVPDPAFKSSGPPPDIIPISDQKNQGSQANNLGDFLSTLQNDVFGTSFGKLN
ncbi:uncharacterized protein LOC117114094 [Anneissia japonica]|uniref:uncharacterized protein LOC117114094 n=1 Tax=Anneissia japonica TaxID=1529436 RepID=UPI00142571BF|nr:uncharacterized protein LOC117114094 [Anneissia japonica]